MQFQPLRKTTVNWKRRRHGTRMEANERNNYEGNLPRSKRAGVGAAQLATTIWLAFRLHSHSTRKLALQVKASFTASRISNAPFGDNKQLLSGRQGNEGDRVREDHFSHPYRHACVNYELLFLLGPRFAGASATGPETTRDPVDVSRRFCLCAIARACSFAIRESTNSLICNARSNRPSTLNPSGSHKDRKPALPPCRYRWSERQNLYQPLRCQGCHRKLR